VIGLVLVLVLAVGSVLAYNKKLPWSHGYEVKAMFTTAQNIRVKSPVRIAGVNVGEVTGVESAPGGQQAAVVTMEINDEGLPIHDDATFKLRPRLFLEGNLFVDLSPGTPESPVASDGHEFPITQTSTSVQLDQVLTTLQSGVRRNLQIFLKEFGNALVKYGGAQGFQELYKTSPGAYKYTSQVNQAFLGTQTHDLSGLVKNLDSTVAALDQNESSLQDLVTNLRIVTGSFAAHDESLQKAVAILPRVLDVAKPALADLNNSFPPLRAFAIEALPGVRSTPPALDAATPFLRQLRGLVSRPELRGLVHKLKPAIPELTQLSKRTVPFLNQSRALSSCFNQVIIPWSNSTVPDPEFPSPGKVFEETGYGLSGIAGESRSGDANGQYIRVAAGGGTNTLNPTNSGFVVQSDPASSTEPFFGFLSSQIQGARPAIDSSLKTPFRPDAPCEKQEPPNLDAGAAGAPPPQEPTSSLGAQAPQLQELTDRSKTYIMDLGKAVQFSQQGKGQRSYDQIRSVAKAWQSFSTNTLPGLLKELGSLGTRNLEGGG
jgi:virulence factor Mce-like protein